MVKTVPEVDFVWRLNILFFLDLLVVWDWLRGKHQRSEMRWGSLGCTFTEDGDDASPILDFESQLWQLKLLRIFLFPRLRVRVFASKCGKHLFSPLVSIISKKWLTRLGWHGWELGIAHVFLIKNLAIWDPSWIASTWGTAAGALREDAGGVGTLGRSEEYAPRLAAPGWGAHLGFAFFVAKAGGHLGLSRQRSGQILQLLAATQLNKSQERHRLPVHVASTLELCRHHLFGKWQFVSGL